jgi:hypothetical protein
MGFGWAAHIAKLDARLEERDRRVLELETALREIVRDTDVAGYDFGNAGVCRIAKRALRK